MQLRFLRIYLSLSFYNINFHDQVQSQVLTTRKKVTTTVEREYADGDTDRTQNVKETLETQTREFDDDLGTVENKSVKCFLSHAQCTK